MKTLLSLLILITNTSLLAVTLNLEFKAYTNVPGVNISGNTLKPISLNIDQESFISIPLNNITTHMDVRDEHMKKEIFGNRPIRFGVKRTSCRESIDCNYDITIFIQDKKVTYTKTLNSNKKQTFDFKIKLDQFSLKAPSRFGVSVENAVDVKAHVILK